MRKLASVRIIKEIKPPITNLKKDEEESIETKGKLSKTELKHKITQVENEMKKAAKEFDFEKAIELRDILFELKGQL